MYPDLNEGGGGRRLVLKTQGKIRDFLRNKTENKDHGRLFDTFF